MSKFDLSILIPARNEMWLGKTIEDIIANSGPRTEVIAVIDGEGNIEDIPQHERVTVVYLQKSIGQRAATNLAARLSKAKWLIKTDSHCSFSQGFDEILMADMQDDWVMVPTMRNLHAFDWVCDKEHRRYQGPSGPCTNCKKCGHSKERHEVVKEKRMEGVCDSYKPCGRPTERDVLWKAKDSPKSRSYAFDSEPHFQYFNEYTKRDEFKKAGDLTESMSIQGSFFMVTRKRYWDLNLSDEGFGSWGSQGIEIAVKSWTTGGKVVINNKCWYAHLFRTQGGDFSFPYPQKHSKVLEGRAYARNAFYESKWRKQIYPISALLEKFWPVTGWSDADYITQKNREIKVTRSGIFSLENQKTGKIYVFSATNINQEAVRQEYLLRQREHPDKELQDSWTRETEKDFMWHVEIFCREASLPKFLKLYQDKISKGEIKHPVVR